MALKISIDQEFALALSLIFRVCVKIHTMFYQVIRRMTAFSGDEIKN